LIIISFLLCFINFYVFQLYCSWRGKAYFMEFFVILKAWSAVIGSLLFLFFLFKVSYSYSRRVVLLWFFLTPFVIFGIHYIVRKVARSQRAKGKNQRFAVVAGAGDLGRQLAEHVENTPWAGINILGFFDDRKKDALQIFGRIKPILGTIDTIKQYLQENVVDYVYIALPMEAEKKIRIIINECRTLGAQIFVVPDIYSFTLLNAEPESIGDMLVLNFNPRKKLKRAFDLAFSSLFLLMTLPLTALISLLIKVEDRGPIFYGHSRITVAGREFKCLKFRTMHVDADMRLSELLANDESLREEWERCFKLKNDPRVTKIGKFLRKTSLDELPQFINVLKGEMSVVGARPIVSKELYDYYKETGNLYCSANPGITGPWQIGKRSDTEDYDERVELDRLYVLNNNFWLDMKIIVKTAWCMIKGKGAY